jgi:hypothetical protein
MKKMLWLSIAVALVFTLAGPQIHAKSNSTPQVQRDGTSPIPHWRLMDGTSPIPPWRLADGTSPIPPWRLMDGTSPIPPWK